MTRKIPRPRQMSIPMVPAASALARLTEHERRKVVTHLARVLLEARGVQERGDER